jgi:outer membrane immunogenic protein
MVMKKLLLASVALVALATGPAMAADLPVKYRPPPPPVPVWTWTGFYIGANIGGAWDRSNVTDTRFGLNFSNGSNNGVFIGGGQLGANVQFGNFVLGAEWDFDWAANNNNTTSGVFVPAVGTLVVTSNDRWISTLAARFGLAYDRVLFYGKAGGGWVGNSNFTITNVTTGASVSGGNNNSVGGWLVGVGVEWAFADNWSAKVEYDYLGLQNRTFTTPAFFLPAFDTFSTGNSNIQMVKLGINYRFGWNGPVAARY